MNNPADYVIVSIIRAGLSDEEITISFGKMTNCKMKAQETGTSFPLSAGYLLEELEKYDLIKVIYNMQYIIYNAISLSDDPLVPKNKFGYAAPKSSIKANKIGMSVNIFYLLFSLIFSDLPVTDLLSCFSASNL